MTTFGHSVKQTSPLKGIGYILLCAFFGFAMYKLGMESSNGGYEDKFACVFFFAAAFISWAIGVILLWDLITYLKSN